MPLLSCSLCSGLGAQPLFPDIWFFILQPGRARRAGSYFPCEPSRRGSSGKRRWAAWT